MYNFFFFSPQPPHHDQTATRPAMPPPIQQPPRSQYGNQGSQYGYNAASQYGNQGYPMQGQQSFAELLSGATQPPTIRPTLNTPTGPPTRPQRSQSTPPVVSKHLLQMK